MARASAPARAALAGNPSDGYGGATLAVVVEDFRADVEIEVLARGHRPPRPGEPTEPAPDLVRATLARFERQLAPGAWRAEVRVRTTIPRSVGLGGSSAIVIATTRALCELHKVELAPDELATFALAVETEELGIAAGLQDRVAQAYGGLTFMDFGAGDYESLDPALLPPLVLAWHPEAAGASGVTHGELRARHAAGERDVHDQMAELAGLARRARSALLEGDGGAFAACLDGSFDARQRMMPLDERHVRMIELARGLGAGANYTGSGGAIVGACADAEHREQVLAALAAAGYEAIAPRVSAREVASRRSNP